jgi:hypothetical protein
VSSPVTPVIQTTMIQTKAFKHVYRNTPIGVLYDLLVPEHDQEPWELCLHFQDYPVDTLPPYVNETSLQDSLRNSLKEASVITTGSATQVISMVSGAHEDLWTAVLRSDVAALKRIFNSIQLNGSPHDGDGHGMKHLPVRIYVRFSTRSSLSDSVDKDYMSSYENIYRTSRPLLAHNPEDGTPHTLCSALSPLLMQHFPPKEGITQSCVWQHVRQLWVGGIRPPDDAILEHLFKEFHGADYFLYIVVHVQRD